MNFPNMSTNIRKMMLDELEYDFTQQQLFPSKQIEYPSKRFNATGHSIWRDALRTQFAEGDPSSLADFLVAENCFAPSESYIRNGKELSRAVNAPAAASTYAEGEFNRFYMRAVCLHCIANKLQPVATRIKDVSNPRPESLALEGKIFDPVILLEDLRSSIGVDTALGLPPGPNSGMSLRFGG